MPDQPKGRFWWGPIRTEKNAKGIVNVVGWIFVALAAFNLLGFQRLPGSHQINPIANLVKVLACAVPGVILLISKGRIWAAATLLVAGYWLFQLIDGIVDGLIMANPYHFLVLLLLPPLLLFDLPLTWVSWRAMKATLFLNKLKRSPSSSDIDEVFG